MSEDLIQKDLTEHGLYFDNYEFFSLGNTTIKSLSNYNIIPKYDYKGYNRLKPDGILVDRSNSKNINVIAVIEYKRPEDFNTQNKKINAAKQCNTYCQLFKANFGLITDKNEYLYINPNIDLEKSEIKYNDNEIFKNKIKERHFSFIKREDGYTLSNKFILNKNDNDSTQHTLKLIKKIISDINNNNSQFNKEIIKNPSNLAKSVWQDVWISKSASPEKSLSTFIEIFMFKFLSDLNIIKENNTGTKVSFDYVYNEVKKEKCLTYYCSNVRNYIKDLFPENINDNTTLINGISLNPDVKEDNIIFYKLLKKFNDFGSLKNIDPEFKSRLFEDFLKKSISKKNWGQFFTPRNVVKAMIEMSDIERLPDGSKVCDPACGVGGFILESNLTKRPNDYYFEEGMLKCKLNYYGFEKGFEIDEKLTIILAKANFIIYLSELLENNPNKTTNFASLFNETFKIYTNTILGSLSEVKENYYDLIMSNPPYVTSGSSNYKEAIQRNAKLKKYYKINGTGVEGLFLEKMIRELKPKGKALIIIPDGILNRLSDIKLRQFILDQCILDAIISLPSKTFYLTPKKTYILVVTKKEKKYVQNEPVFTYLISNIGETLDANRFPIEENDLKDMVRDYNYFMSNKNDFQPNNPRCKIQKFERFIENIGNHWSIDRWWTEEEKIKLGLEEEKIILSEDEFYDKIDDLKNKLISLFDDIKSDKEKSVINLSNEEGSFRIITLGNEDFFSLQIGKRVLKKDLINSNGTIPLYSANVSEPIGYLNKSNLNRFSHDYILWGIDGNFEVNSMSRGIEFATTDHCGTIEIINESINYMYLIYQLNIIKSKYGFDRSLRPSLTKMKEVMIKFPVKENGELDYDKQKELAEKFIKVNNLKNFIEDNLKEFKELNVDF